MELQVGVKAIIQNKEGKYLVLARNFATYPDISRDHKWDIPGGRITVGAPILDNLRREIKEETGLDMTGDPKIITAQDILRGTTKHVVRLTFLVQVASGPVIVDSKEHEGYEWFTSDDLLKRDDIDAYLRESIGKLAQMI